MHPLNTIHIPDFKEFIVTPHNNSCALIDSTRLMVEVLGWLQSASWEFGSSSFSSKVLLDWRYSLVIRYRRERDNTFRPACAFSFDSRDTWVHVQQIQWSNDKSVAFRFHSSFNTTAFLLRLLEESFLKRGIPVSTEKFPQGLENASYSSKASERYAIFRSAIEWLNAKYSKKQVE